MAKVGPKSRMNEWCQPDNLILLSGWARQGLTDEQIMHNMGVSNWTFYEWKKKCPEISEALRKTKDMIDYEVECALLKNAMSGNVTAQIFWLKNRRKEQWREKVELPTNPQELNKVQQLLDKLKEEANDGTK